MKIVFLIFAFTSFNLFNPNIFHGNWEGQIIFNPRGKNGFGYDPLFYIDKLERTAAELSQDEKNKLSHRAIAMRKVTNHLAKENYEIK